MRVDWGAIRKEREGLSIGEIIKIITIKLFNEWGRDLSTTAWRLNTTSEKLKADLVGWGILPA